MLIAVGLWLWRVLFPSPERAIRSRLADLATTMSVEHGEGNITRALHYSKLPDFFTPDVAIATDLRGYPPVAFEGRDELMRWIAAARQNWSWMKVEFLDLNVALGPDKQTAVVNLTGKATVPGERDFLVQEFNFMFKKVDGKWLIYRIESVKTLSGLDAAPHRGLESPRNPPLLRSSTAEGGQAGKPALRGRRIVAQTFLSAGSGDFPVAPRSLFRLLDHTSHQGAAPIT